MGHWTSSASRVVARLPAAAVLCSLVVGAQAAPAAGQTDETPQLHVHALQHQSAIEAVGIIHPLLSTEGSLELRADTNTLLIRDLPSRLRRAVAALEAWDHPPRNVSLDLRLVEAGPHRLGDGARAALPEPILGRLRQLLRYDRYDVLGGAAFEARERESVDARLSDRYSVSFRLGTVFQKSLRLHGFQVARSAPEQAPRQLIRTDLSVPQDRPMVLGLSSDEASERALMVIVSMRPPGVN